MDFDELNTDHLRKLVGRLHAELARDRTPALVTSGGVSRQECKPQTLALAERVIRPYIHAYSRDPSRLEREAVRSRSYAARSLLALVATSGRLDLQTLAECVEAEAAGTSTALDLEPKAALALARVLAAQPLCPSDLGLAVELFQQVRRGFGPGALSDIDWIDLIGLLTTRSRRSEAWGLMSQSGLGAREPYEYYSLRANLLHGQWEGDARAEWLASLNSMFEMQGIEHIDIESGAGAVIDRITCAPASQIEDGPMVSVLMTNYCVGEPLGTAVASVMAQTWRRLELIIVDDCSPDDEFARIRELQSLDERITVLRTERNCGTYSARNLALSRARGDFVTCHDSDDWSHPRKVEIQVRRLLDTGAIGNVSRWTRATEDLRLQQFSATGKYIYPNASSLMFLRAPVQSRLGAWDTVRTGADTEFQKRLELVFGQKLEVLPGGPLSFARTRANALTAGTLSRGWSSPQRQHYRASWAYWQRQTGATGEGLPPLPAAPRLFPAPADILPTPGSLEHGPFDVVIIADLRDGKLAPALTAELGVLIRSDYKVALCHLPGLRKETAGRESLNDSIQGLLNRRCVTRIELTDSCVCKLAVVRDPASLQFASEFACQLDVQDLLIATDYPPHIARSRTQSYGVSAVMAAARRLFGQEAKWATSNLAVRARVSTVLSDTYLLAQPWGPVIDHTAFPERREGREARGDAVTIGFCAGITSEPFRDWSLDDPRLFPSEGVHVWVVRGSAPSVEKCAGATAANWQIVDSAEQSLESFLANVDVLPFYPKHKDAEAITPALAQALAAGCVVFAPPSMRGLLGDAALCVDTEQVQPLIAVLSRSPDLLTAQSRRARDFAARQLSQRAFSTRVGSLLSRAIAPDPTTV